MSDRLRGAMFRRADHALRTASRRAANAAAVATLLALAHGAASAHAPRGAVVTEFRAAIPLDRAWSRLDYWDNPRVERSIFSFRFRGREAKMTMLVEAEWTDLEHLVKPQDLEAVGRRPSGRAAHSMEMHQLLDMPATFGPFGAFNEVLVERDTMAPLKWGYLFHDTCGGIVKRLFANRKPPTLAVDGYWEGIAEYESPPLDGAWLDEALPLTLRALPLAPGYAARVPLALTGRGRATEAPRVVPATIAAAEESVSVPAGRFDAWRVDVRADGFDGVYWLARTPVREVIAYEVGATRYALLSRDIIDYANE